MTLPNAIPAVEAVVARAAATFQTMLKCYRPWYRPGHAEQRSGSTEQNLTFQLAHAFSSIYGDAAFAAMEVPVLSERKHYENRLDSYLFAPDLAVLLECKVHCGNDSLEDVSRDMNRITPSVLDLVRKRHHENEPCEARETVAMILVEAWGRNGSCLEWWREQTRRDKKGHGKLPSDCHYDGREIHKASANSDGTLYWLYAYRPLRLET